MFGFISRGPWCVDGACALGGRGQGVSGEGLVVGDAWWPGGSTLAVWHRHDNPNYLACPSTRPSWHGCLEKGRGEHRALERLFLQADGDHLGRASEHQHQAERRTRKRSCGIRRAGISCLISLLLSIPITITQLNLITQASSFQQPPKLPTPFFQQPTNHQQNGHLLQVRQRHQQVSRLRDQGDQVRSLHQGLPPVRHLHPRPRRHRAQVLRQLQPCRVHQVCVTLGPFLPF